MTFVWSSFVKAYRLGLKSIQIWWFSFFFSFFLFFFLSGHWKTSNLAEQAIEITIQWKCEIAQQYWLPLYFTLNNTKQTSCFHVSPRKKSSARIDFLFLNFPVYNFSDWNQHQINFLLCVYILINFWNYKSKLPKSAHGMQEYNL